MKNKSVTIIIPCYNAASWLSATVESALAQTWPHKEIIIVNDGSTDTSLAIAQSFATRGVRVIDQKNRGAASARNAGLRAASGAFIQFLDADDLLAPGKISAQMERLSTASEGAIASGPWGVFHDQPETATFSPEPVWADFAPLDWLVTAWSGAWMFPPLVWLTPRHVLDEAGPWDETLSLDDDGEYFCRVLLQASAVCFSDRAKSYYRRHAGPRISASRGLRAAQSSFTSNQQKEKLTLAREDSSRVRHALACNWQRFVWEQISDAPALARQALVRSRQLDASLPAPQGPRLYSFLAPLLGWRTARRLQLSAQRIFRQ